MNQYQQDISTVELTNILFWFSTKAATMSRTICVIYYFLFWSCSYLLFDRILYQASLPSS